MRCLTGRHLHSGALRVCEVVGFGVGVCLVCQGWLVVGGRSVIVGVVSRREVIKMHPEIFCLSNRRMVDETVVY